MRTVQRPSRLTGDANWAQRRLAALISVAPYFLLGILPIYVWVITLNDVAGQQSLAFDFQHFFYPQAREVIEGRIPSTAYPPLTTLLYVPFALLPSNMADIAVTAAWIACIGATLPALEVRDWRCYGAAALWPPVYGAVQSGNLTPLLMLGVALLWRWRSRAFLAGILTALMIAAKLFLWPLALWLIATRRYRAAAIMVGAGLLSSAAAWAVIDFSAITQFPVLVRGNVQDNGLKPYTIIAILQQLGAPVAVSYAACWTAGVVALTVAVRIARSGREADGLALVLGAALLLSPIVWAHYLAILLVPFALAHPRFTLLWLAPLPLLLCPQVGGSLPQKFLLIMVGALIVAFAIGGRRTGLQETSTTTSAEPVKSFETLRAGFK